MKTKLLRHVGGFVRSTKAVSALEYAVLAGVVVAIVGAAVATFSDTIADAIATVGTDIQTGVATIDDADLSDPD